MSRGEKESLDHKRGKLFFFSALTKPPISFQFAGTYGNFGAALRVNPWDTQEVADAIYEALVMNEEDKTYRWKNLYSYVNTNTGKVLEYFS